MPKQLADCLKDLDAQDVVILNLERAVQLCVDIGAHLLTTQNIRPPEAMSDVFEEHRKLRVLSDELSAKLRLAVGFRNLAVHDYKQIDHKKVFDLANSSLVDLKNYAASVLGHLNSKSPGVLPSTK